MSGKELTNFITFEEIFNGDVWILRCMGLSYFNRVFSNKKETEKWWEKIIPLCGILTMSLLISMEIIRALRVIVVDIPDATEILTAMLSGMLCTFKAIRCWTHRKELFEFLRKLKILWETANLNNFVTDSILDTVLFARSLRNYLTYTCIALAVSYGFPAYIVLGSHLIFYRDQYFFNLSIIIYPVDYPFVINSYGVYFMCLLFEQVAELLAIVFWLCGDALFIQLTTHVYVQCMILVNRLHDINKTKIASSEENNKELADIIFRHHQLYLHCCWLQKFFSPIAFFVTLINGANLCFSLYRVDGEINEQNWSNLLINVLHLVAVLGQTVLYCKYADTLAEKFEEISYAVYYSNWTHCDKKLKTMMIMIIRRAQKRYQFTIYGIITLNLLQFTRIVNAAMSYFALLRSFG
ncbi:odorant receptor 67c-like [Cotesia glomerata]|uniref:odorant receptor 67c-like n=1 Tax=Cotesia glomerata TaxID=32391 RepID=UPI001D01EB8C|nr:odorant receptor 67c-like [Cotesia glomerata]